MSKHIKSTDIKYIVNENAFRVGNTKYTLRLDAADYKDLLYVLSNMNNKPISIDIPVENIFSKNYYIKIGVLCILYKRTLRNEELVYSLTTVYNDFIDFLKECCYAQLVKTVQSKYRACSPKRVMGFSKSPNEIKVNAMVYKFKDLSALSNKLAFIELDCGTLVKFNERLFIVEPDREDDFKITYDISNYLGAFM